MFHTLLDACRLVGDSNNASRVQAAVERVGLIALALMATALVQGTASAFATVGQSDAQLFAEQRVQDFNVQGVANTAWAFATVGRLDITMVSVMSQEIFEWIRGYKATCQIGEGL